MVQPIDYASMQRVVNPGQSFMQGLQLGQGIREVRQKREDEQRAEE